MKLDPVSLRLFVAVMENATIAAAAASQFIATSAASRRLADLERQLDVVLFQRSNKGVTPTPAAYALLNLARTVLNDLDGIGMQMQSYRKGMLGQVRIAANISAITQFLPHDLRGFLSHYPGVQIQLDERISSGVAQAVLSNTADLGILNEGQYGDGLEFLPYRQDELVLVMPADHPLRGDGAVSMQEALAYDFVGAHQGSVINNLLILSAAACKQQLRMRIHVTSFDAMCLMVSAGLGIGVLPAGSARLYISTLGLVTRPLEETWAKRRLMICVRENATHSKAGELLLDYFLSSERIAT